MQFSASGSAAFASNIQFAHLAYSLLALDGLFYSRSLSICSWILDCCEKQINYAHWFQLDARSLYLSSSIEFKVRTDSRLGVKSVNNQFTNTNIWLFNTSFGMHYSSFEAWFAQRMNEKQIQKEWGKKAKKIKEQQPDWQYSLLVHFSWTSDILIALKLFFAPVLLISMLGELWMLHNCYRTNNDIASYKQRLDEHLRG